MDCSKLDEKIIVEIHKIYPDLDKEVATERLFICTKCWKLIEILKSHNYNKKAEFNNILNYILNDILANNQRNKDILDQHKKHLNFISKLIELEKEFS